MSFIHAPAVPFRAHRTYLHSTTLYKEIIAGAENAGLMPDGAVELRVRRLMRRQPELHYSRSPLPLADDAPAVFSLSAGGMAWHGAVIERDEPIGNREPYDETAVLSRAVADGSSIRVNGPTGMHPIEVITSLTLLLHQRLFEIEQDRKWYLARIALARPLQMPDTDQITVALARRFGKTMTRCAISFGDESLGFIEFIVGPIG